MLYNLYYDARIKAYVDELCPNLLTIPGVGYVTAGLIAGEIRDINHLHSFESLVSYAGIDVTVYQSGKYNASHLLPPKKGSRYLRYALFKVARIVLDSMILHLKPITRKKKQRVSIIMLFSVTFKRSYSRYLLDIEK